MIVCCSLNNPCLDWTLPSSAISVYVYVTSTRLRSQINKATCSRQVLLPSTAVTATAFKAAKLVDDTGRTGGHQIQKWKYVWRACLHEDNARKRPLPMGRWDCVYGNLYIDLDQIHDQIVLWATFVQIAWYLIGWCIIWSSKHEIIKSFMIAWYNFMNPGITKNIYSKTVLANHQPYLHLPSIAFR